MSRIRHAPLVVLLMVAVALSSCDTNTVLQPVPTAAPLRSEASSGQHASSSVFAKFLAFVESVKNESGFYLSLNATDGTSLRQGDALSELRRKSVQKPAGKQGDISTQGTDSYSNGPLWGMSAFSYGDGGAMAYSQSIVHIEHSYLLVDGWGRLEGKCNSTSGTFDASDAGPYRSESFGGTGSGQVEASIELRLPAGYGCLSTGGYATAEHYTSTPEGNFGTVTYTN